MSIKFPVRSLLSLFLALLALGVGALPALANVGFGGGEYTNLCGSGTSASFYNCPANCSTGSGSCGASGNYVVRYVCDGRQTECRSNESGFSSSQSVGGVGCGKTVQVDVFNKTCRVNGNWICGSNDLTGYMTWYSGNCAPANPAPPAPTPQPTPTPTASPSPTPTPTPSPSPSPTPVPPISSCDSLQVASGNNANVPAKVVLRARGSDNKGGIQQYRFYFGDGNRTETTDNEITHTYDSSGSYLARVDIKDSQGNWKSNSSCETTVYVTSSPVESHRSGCSDLFIVSGQSQQPPSKVNFQLTGYDNKGGIQNYRLDFGNGIVKDSNGQTFEQIYDKAGTYTVIGSIKDSEGNWQNSDSCKTTVYVNTSPITKQPSTGTPTMWSVIGMMSGTSGALLSMWYWPKARKLRRR